MKESTEKIEGVSKSQHLNRAWEELGLRWDHIEAKSKEETNILFNFKLLGL